MITDQQLLKTAIEAAKSAGEILRDGFGTVFDVSYKGGSHNIVTKFDTLCEAKIKEIVQEAVPTSSFLGEETGHTDNQGDVHWIVDPLDGTVNFAHGIPIFSVSIAAVVSGVLAIGVVYHPLLDELFACVRGQGATLNGKSIMVSNTQLLDDSMLVTGFPYSVRSNPEGCIEQFTRIVSRGLPVRRLGSAALDLAYLAAGRFDGYWEVSLNPWDMAAGVLLVQESGGRVTHYNGVPFVLSKNSVVATNGRIHEELLVALSD
jgi:myo-inositol-1(or 4)-monophosphatase